MGCFNAMKLSFGDFIAGNDSLSVAFKPIHAFSPQFLVFHAHAGVYAFPPQVEAIAFEF